MTPHVYLLSLLALQILILPLFVKKWQTIQYKNDKVILDYTEGSTLMSYCISTKRKDVLIELTYTRWIF